MKLKASMCSVSLIYHSIRKNMQLEVLILHLTTAQPVSTQGVFRNVI
jgi:hypothetical protein